MFHRRALLLLGTAVLALPGMALQANVPALAIVPTDTGCAVGTPCFRTSDATNLGPAGGEPSLQDDGAGNIYITTPIGLFVGGTGVRFSRSTNGGQTFDQFAGKPYKDIGGGAGGGDSDVVIDSARKNLYVADLYAAAAAVVKSQDKGDNFTFPGSQAGPENDRQWLTTIGPNVYLTYHDFVGNVPLIFGSTDGGQTFPPGLGFAGTGQIFAPSDPGFADAHCNTLVGKPVTDKDGVLYILTNTSTIQEDFVQGLCVQGAPLDRFYLSVSKDGGHSFTSHLVSDLSAAGNPTQAQSGSWGHVFNQMAIDAGGNLYIDASGNLDGTPGKALQNYLLVSKDHGVTFSKPIPTHAESANAQLLPAIAAGQAGQVAVGYYRGLMPDHHSDLSNFQFYVDQTFNGLDANPAFTHTQLQPLAGTTPHPKGICTDGTFCGITSNGGNRNLLDFESMTVDAFGHLEIVIPADQDGTTTENWFYRQSLGPQMPPGATNGNGTGNQTYVAGARTEPPPGATAAANTPPRAPSAPAGSPFTPTLPKTGTQAPSGMPLGTVLVLLALAVLGAGGLRRERKRRSEQS